MLDKTPECFNLNATAIITLSELAECCGMVAAELDELVGYNSLQPIDKNAEELTFSAHWVMPLRNVARLRNDFDLDLFTVALVLDNLDRIAQLEGQVQSLKALLPSHTDRCQHE